MEDSISLKEIMLIIQKKLLVILLTTFIVVGIVSLISIYFLSPVYQSTSQILINQSKESKDGYNTVNIETDLQLINTYNIIIKSSKILEKVKSDLHLNESIKDIKEKINVKSESETQIINIIVEDSDPIKAANIANKTAEIFKIENADIMKIDNVSILETAIVADHAKQPTPIVLIIISVFIGLMIGIGIAFLLNYFDNKIKREEDIENLVDLPILAVISNIKMLNKPTTFKSEIVYGGETFDSKGEF